VLQFTDESAGTSTQEQLAVGTVVFSTTGVQSVSGDLTGRLTEESRKCSLSPRGRSASIATVWTLKTSQGP